MYEHPDKNLVLVIDQGGQSSRVAVYRHTGERICIFSSPCATYTFTDEHNRVHVEQDGEEILAGIRSCLENVQQTLGDDIRQITAAGFAGQGSSLLCWNKTTGAVLSPVLSWQDRRAESVLLDLPLTQADVQQRTGLRISPHYGASKIHWCLEHLDAVKSAAQRHQVRIGPIASYLFDHLLQNTAPRSFIDPGHAQRTLLWNLSTHTWDTELLAAFGIDDTILPICHWHNSVFGELVLDGHVIPLRSCQRDQGASLFARGIPDIDACYINIGTGAFIQRVSDNLSAPEGLLVSPLWLPDPADPAAKKYYAWEATVNGAAAAISWLEDNVQQPITPALIDSALATQSEKAGIYFLNAVGGLSAPYWRTDLTSCFSGDLTVVEKIQAWLESVLFQLCVNFQLMRPVGPVQRVYVSGGLSRADGLCQRLADLTGLVVLRSDNADATLQGVAYTTAGMPAQWQPPYEDDEFIPAHNPLLHERFKHWQTAMQRWLNS